MHSPLRIDTEPHIDSAALRRRLEQIAGNVPTEPAVVALSSGDGSWCAGTGLETECREWRFDTGCITKLFTSALVLEAVRNGELTLHDSVARAVGCRDPRGVLRGLTIRHLLEHTHGLDDSAIGVAPLGPRCRIDTEALLERLHGPPRWSAGELYSYSDIGPWLAAAAVEHVSGLSFRDALARRLFEPLGIEARQYEPAARDDRICASRGGSLQLSTGGLLRFLEHMLARHSWPTGAAGVPLSGWSFAERGIYLGWKRFADGWYGHNSVYSPATAIVRIHPASSTALIVASAGTAANLIAAKLFGRSLPELRNANVPPPMPTERWAQADPERYCGTFDCDARQLAIRRGSGGLVLRGADFESQLVPCADHLFLARPAKVGRPAYVQLVAADRGGYRYLWDGQQLLVNTRCRVVSSDSTAIATR